MTRSKYRKMMPSNSVTYTERLYKLELPVSLAYEFTIEKIHYFVRGGFSVGKITGITGHASRKFADEITVSSENRDISHYRQNFLYSGIIGAGVRYKIPRGVLTFDLRANIGRKHIRHDARHDNR